MKRSELARKPMKRSQPRRDWAEARRKVILEGKCRVCGEPRQNQLEAAHIIGRHVDKPKTPGSKVLFVDPWRVVPLCHQWDRPGCHALYDAHRLDLRPYLTDEEFAKAVMDGDTLGAALRRITGKREAA